MLDPYRMVFVNIAASCLVLTGIIIYRYFYPKKKINLFVLLIIISILPIISIFRAGDYESGDFNIHIYRIMSFHDSLAEGNIMPSWAGELNATYGNPLFIFNYSLPYYIISIFHFLRISFIDSTKIYLGLTLYLSGIFMYLWIKDLTKNKLAAFSASIFYTFSPYHLIDVHFRTTLGESTIFMIVPLQMLFITKYLSKKRIIDLVLLNLFTGLLFLAHPLMGIVFFFIEIFYLLFLLFREKTFKRIAFCAVGLSFGFLGSMYSWASFPLYSPYTFKFPASSGAIVGFYPFQQLFYSPWRYGLLFQGHYGELALIVGYVQIFVLIFSIVLIILKKVHKEVLKDYLFWAILFLVFLFLMNPVSAVLWKNTPSIANMLSPYGRLSLVLSLCTSVIAGYLIITLLRLKVKKIYICLILISAIGSTILNWGHRRLIPEIDDSVLRKNVWKSTSSEGPSYFMNTKWTDKRGLWFDKLPLAPLEIIEGKGVIKKMEKSSTKHLYLVDAKTSIKIRENTLYFPGWSLKSNNREIPITPDKKGIISAKIPKGIQNLELTYKDLHPYDVLKKIFQIWIIISVVFIAVYLILRLSNE